MPTSWDIFKLIPQSSGVQSIEAVNASFGGDFFDRSFIVVHFAQPLIYANGSFNLAEMQKLSMIENTTAHMSGIQGIFGPTYPYGNFISLSSMQSYPGGTAQMYLNQSRSFIGANSKYAEIVFETSSLAWTTPASVTVSNLNNALSANTSNLGYTYNIMIRVFFFPVENWPTFVIRFWPGVPLYSLPSLMLRIFLPYL